MHQDQLPEIFFHVGLARAASTYLQHKVFPYLQGVHYIPPNRYRRYQHIIASTHAARYLVSREFDQRLACESQKFAQLFPEARIIMVLRRSDRWIASRYRQLVKNGHGLSFQEFFDIDHDRGLWKINAASMFAKIKIVETYFRHKPLVLFHEDLATAPFDFFDKIARFMGSTYNRERISLKPFHTSYSDKQLHVMLRVSKGLFSMQPSQGNSRWRHWWKRRSRLLACYLILYPAALLPRALVRPEPLIEPQILGKIRDFFAEDWRFCQEYAMQHNRA
jgi:hypothetical protein